MIQLDLEEFKSKYPEIRSLDPDMIKYRYNAAEKFRIQSINLLKKERQRIIDGDEIPQNEDNFRKTVTSMSKTGGFNRIGNVELSTDEKMEQILKEQKKAIHKIKQKQRQDIQALIKLQIDKEISEKINIEKQRRQKEKEEENNRELEKMRMDKERKLKQKEKKRISELNRQMEEQKMRFKLKEEKEQQKQLELIEAERKKQEENKKKKNIEMRKLNERKKALEELNKERENKLKQKQIEQQIHEEELNKKKNMEIIENKKNQEKKDRKIKKSALLKINFTDEEYEQFLKDLDFDYYSAWMT